MLIPNPKGTTLEELLPRLQQHYPGAEIKKFWIFPAYIHIPVRNFKLWVRRRSNRKLFTDFQPPVAWMISAMLVMVLLFSIVFTLLLRTPTFAGIGWLPVVIAVLGVKAIFKSRNKELFARFDADVARAAEGAGEGGIF